MIALFYGVVITKPDKSPVETVKSNDQLKGMRDVYKRQLVTTAPGVIYKVYKTNGEVINLTNPSNLPDPSEIEYMEEPVSYTHLDVYKRQVTDKTASGVEN